MIESRLNPVLVREMRQAVRSRAVISLMFIYLLLLGGACFYTLLVEAVVRGISDATALGEELASQILWIAFGVTALVVLLHTGGRLVAERVNNDMMFVSTLKPRSIALGKFQAGLVLSLFLYSMTMPFLTIAYILRGVDLWALTLCVVASFVLIQTLNSMVLAFFAGIRAPYDFAARLVPFLLCAGLLLWFTLELGSEIFDDITTRGLDGEEIFVLGLLSSFFFVLIPLAMLCLASCQCAPETTNRMMPTRIFVSIIYWISLFASVFAAGIAQDFHFLLFWLLLAMYPFVFFSLIATCERGELGLRVRSGIPFDFWGRAIFFPLYTGDCNAIAWLLCGIPPAGVAALMTRMTNNTYVLDHLFPICSTILLSFNYAVTTIAVQYPLRRWIPKDRSWMITLALLCLGVVASIALGSVYVRLVWSPWHAWHDMLILVPNPFWIYDGSGNFFSVIQLMLAILWFLTLLPFVGFWIVRRFKKFVAT